MSREEAISMMAFQTGILTGIHSKGDDIEPACEEAVDLVLKAYFDTHEALYVDASDCEPSFEGNHVWTFDSDCLECGQETRPVVQVWPKEDNDGH